MPTVVHERLPQCALWMAADLIEPVQDYNIPLPQHKLPRKKDNTTPSKQPPVKSNPPEQSHEPTTSNSDGHIDDYA